VRNSRLHCRTAMFNFVHQLAAGEVREFRAICPESLESRIVQA
jgi:hypothetical protein